MSAITVGRKGRDVFVCRGADALVRAGRLVPLQPPGGRLIHERAGLVASDYG